jgi:GT2 family glycosyltransferase
MNKEKTGIGIITCNRENYFLDCINSIDKSSVDYIVVVNDGKELSQKVLNSIKDDKIFYIKNEKNLGVSKTKNKAFRYLLDNNCEHIFLLEDDCIIVNNKVWDAYINAFKETGISHFNYGPGSPWNRVQKDPTVIGDLSKRHLADQTSEPNPKLTVSYNNIDIALYQHIVAMFTYFHKSILEKVGLLDETFYNAWEHVEHTYRIIKEKKYTPFWWFADLANSHEYIKEAKDEKANSSLAKDENTFMDNTINGLQHFYNLHGTVPSTIYPASREEVLQTLKTIYNSK